MNYIPVQIIVKRDAANTDNILISTRTRDPLTVTGQRITISEQSVRISDIENGTRIDIDGLAATFTTGAH